MVGVVKAVIFNIFNMRGRTISHLQHLIIFWCEVELLSSVVVHTSRKTFEVVSCNKYRRDRISPLALGISP